MLERRGAAGTIVAAMLVFALAMLAFATSASAELTGAYTRFQQCPWTTEGVARCAYSLTTGGEVVLGSKAVPIKNSVVLQGGYSAAITEGEEVGYEKFFAAKNGVTLEEVAQPVPGGLVGLVPPESSPPLIKGLVEAAVENKLTGVDSVLQLARPASEIRVNENHLAAGGGVGLKLPVKVHLENPFLGSSCYVGSSGSPIKWGLRMDTTEPPKPNEPITGNPGETEYLEEGRIVELFDVVVVDNAWSAPGPTGCAGALAFLVDPIIAAQLGSTEAGHNTAILKASFSEVTTAAVNRNDLEHP